MEIQSITPELEEKGLMYYGRKEIIIEDISKL